MKWKRFLRKVLLWVGIPWFVMFVWFNLDPPNYRLCDLYTKEMNGGIRTFQGKSYKVVLCGLDGRFDMAETRYDEVWLRVFSMDGELLAERYFSPLLGMGDFGLHLKYGDDYLAYETEDEGPTRKIEMPPTRLEWLRARLPRPWPF